MMTILGFVNGPGAQAPRVVPVVTRVVLRLATVGAVIAVAAGCGKKTPARQVHPMPEAVPTAAEVDVVISMDSTVTMPLDVAALARRLRDADEELVIGEQDGHDGELIGEVLGLARQTTGDIVVFDRQFSALRMFDASGAFVGSYGAAGEGPDEFQFPKALVHIADKEYAVVDGNGTVTVVESGARDLAPVRTFSVDRGSYDFCVAGEHLFAQFAPLIIDESDERPGAIRKYTMQGALLDDFGSTYAFGNPAVRQNMAEGRIGCSTHGDVVALMFQHLPVVRGFSIDGELQWTTLLADMIVPNLIGALSDGMPSAAPDREQLRSDHLQRIVALPGGFALIQVVRGWRGGAPRPVDAGLHTYLLDLGTGEGAYIGKTLPLIFKAYEEYLLATGWAGYPQVRVLRY